MARNPSLASILLTALLLASSAAAAPPDPGPALGTNITWLRPNTGEWPFVDAFKNSLPRVPSQLFGCFGCPEAGDLDENGWVPPEIGQLNKVGAGNALFSLESR